MKRTTELQIFLQRLNLDYCSPLVMALPKLAYTAKELKEFGVYDKNFKNQKNKVLGLSFHRKDTGLPYSVIYLNVHNTDFLWQIVDTLVHELVHLKYPNLKHGSKFQKRINRVIINGK